MDVTPKVYVDRQETDEICSSLSIAKGDNGDVSEMGIYFDEPVPVLLASAPADDPLCLGIGCHHVHTRKETSEVSIKRTHAHTKSTYMQPEFSCRI